LPDGLASEIQGDAEHLGCFLSQTLLNLAKFPKVQSTLLQRVVSKAIGLQLVLLADLIIQTGALVQLEYTHQNAKIYKTWYITTPHFFKFLNCCNPPLG